MRFENRFQPVRGACSFSSRSNAENFSRSRRSMSSRGSLWQDSRRYLKAARDAASVFGFFVSLVSSRNSAPAVATYRCPF